MHVYTQGTPPIENGFKLFLVSTSDGYFTFFLQQMGMHICGNERNWILAKKKPGVCLSVDQLRLPYASMMRGFRNMVCCNGKIVSLDDDYSQHITMRYYHWLVVWNIFYFSI